MSISTNTPAIASPPVRRRRWSGWLIVARVVAVSGVIASLAGLSGPWLVGPTRSTSSNSDRSSFNAEYDRLDMVRYLSSIRPPLAIETFASHGHLAAVILALVIAAIVLSATTPIRATQWFVSVGSMMILWSFIALFDLGKLADGDTRIGGGLQVTVLSILLSTLSAAAVLAAQRQTSPSTNVFAAPEARNRVG